MYIYTYTYQGFSDSIDVWMDHNFKINSHMVFGMEGTYNDDTVG